MNTIRLAVAWFLIFSTTVCLAQPSVHLSRHARKIHKAFSQYPSGSLLHVFFRDGTNEFGTLGAETDRSFELTDQATGIKKSFAYEDVDRVYSGARSSATQLPGTHRKLAKYGALIIIGAAAAVAVGILASQHD